LGSFELFLTAVVLAGVIQIVLGILRLGIISTIFPNVLIKGMLTAIGLLIIFKQFPHAIGYDKDFEGDEAFFQVDGENTFSELVHSLNYITPGALMITTVSILILIFWETKRIQQSFLRFIPGPLVVVILGIVSTLVFAGTQFELIPEHRVDLGLSGKNMTELFTHPDFSQILSGPIWVIAFTLALVASIETLLSVDASDKLDPLKRTTNSNRELFAQGTGNIISGLLGGLPLTQVIVRTSANVNSGGLSKLSAIFHGVLIAVAVITIPNVFNFVPYASLAAILIMVGYKLAKPKLFKEVWQEGKRAFALFVITIVAILLSDLLKGIGVGFAVSLVMIFIEQKRLNIFRKSYTTNRANGTLIFQFAEKVNHFNKTHLNRSLQTIEPNTEVVFDFTSSKEIAADIKELIATFKNLSQQKNIVIHILN
jgi:MFS superfamily sulfate permease-like transporter